MIRRKEGTIIARSSRRCSGFYRLGMVDTGRPALRRRLKSNPFHRVRRWQCKPNTRLLMAIRMATNSLYPCARHIHGVTDRSTAPGPNRPRHPAPRARNGGTGVFCGEHDKMPRNRRSNDPVYPRGSLSELKGAPQRGPGARNHRTAERLAVGSTAIPPRK